MCLHFSLNCIIILIQGLVIPNAGFSDPVSDVEKIAKIAIKFLEKSNFTCNIIVLYVF